MTVKEMAGRFQGAFRLSQPKGESAAAMVMGCVYIFGNQGLSGYKIGQTIRAPETRAGEVTRSYGTPYKFEVVSKHAVEDPAIVEALAHRILHRYRIPRSELFDCNLATCKRAVKAAALLALERPWWKRLWHWIVLPRLSRSRESHGVADHGNPTGRWSCCW